MFYIITMVQSVGYYYPYHNYYASSPLEEYQEQSANGSAGSALGLLLASEGIRAASNSASKLLMRGKEYTTPENVLKVTQDMLKKNKLNVDVHFVSPLNIHEVSEATRIPVQELMDVAKGKNAFFASSHNVAVAPASKPSLIQHELGHAINSKSKFLKALQNSRRYSVYVPTALILLNAISKIGKKKDNKETLIEKYAGAIGFASYLPTIIEEGVASYRGIHAAKKTLGGQHVKLGALRRNYFFAWLTYLLAGVGLGIASKLSVKTGIPYNG